MKETIDELKKDRGISKAPLKNREKAVIVDALKGKPALREKLKMAKSSHYYQRTCVSFSANTEMIAGLLQRYSTIINNDMSIVELRWY